MSYKIAILALVALQALYSSALPPCVCTRVLKDVCGSDGKTYGNLCLLDCEKHKTGTNITVAKDGPCDAVEQSCTCTFEYKPVCGNDGNTYPNRCALLCKRSVNKNIDVASEGACTPQYSCSATANINYVCGSDGNTYVNPSLLNCAAARNPTLRIQHVGKCDDSVKVAEPTVPSCFCTYEFDPVCGSDGVTYSNPCQLNCETAKDSTLRVQHAGKCEDVQVVNPVQGDQPQGCPCPKLMKPVCGSDGVTYNNECLLRCAGAQVNLAKNAPC